MKNLKVDPFVGNSIYKVAEEAKRLAIEKERIIEFDLNGIKCLVSKDTNTEWLIRDYMNAWTMEWKIIGPDCLPFYEQEVQAELENRIKLQEEKDEKESEEYRKKEAAEKAVFDLKVVGIELELKDIEGWHKSREANTDPYGKAALDYAEGWAKLMQIEIAKGKTVKECAENTSFELNFLGITGFMYGCAVNLLSQCWVHGEDLRKWHNKEYGHEGDGVVNPAILSVDIPDK